MRLIFQDRFWFVHIPFIRMVQLQFLALFPVDHVAHPVLYSFCANLLHTLIMWLIVSSLSPYAYICYFVASYLFLLWYNWSLWSCFVQLFEEIQFFSLGFSFFDMSKIVSYEKSLLSHFVQFLLIFHLVFTQHLGCNDCFYVHQYFRLLIFQSELVLSEFLLLCLSVLYLIILTVRGGRV